MFITSYEWQSDFLDFVFISVEEFLDTKYLRVLMDSHKSNMEDGVLIFKKILQSHLLVFPFLFISIQLEK